MNVVAKFQCETVGEKDESGNVLVFFRAVTTGSEENKSFSKYTPFGEAKMSINEETPAHEAFEQGKEYLFTISPAS